MIIFNYSQIEKPTLDESSEFFQAGIESRMVRYYHEFKIDMAAIFGADKEYAEKEINEVLEFEIALANVRFTDE